MEEAASPAGVLDGHGRILVANHALETLLGVGLAGGLTGRSLPSLAYPPDEELAHAAVQQVLVEGLDRCQVDARWVRVHSRELVWGAWDHSLVRDRRGRPELAIAMVRDLTEMKRSDHERRFFEFMLKLIGEADSSNPETGDRYGASLTPGNFDGNELPDLGVGAPGETVAGAASAGAADARDGDVGGLPADPDEPLYFLGNDGVPGTAEAGDRFAAALSA